MEKITRTIYSVDYTVEGWQLQSVGGSVVAVQDRAEKSIILTPPKGSGDDGALQLYKSIDWTSYEDEFVKVVSHHLNRRVVSMNLREFMENGVTDLTPLA